MFGKKRKKLLVTAANVYLFPKDMQTGEIRKDGIQPFLPDVLSGKVAFSIKRHTPGPGCFSVNYARQMVNALTRLQVQQYALLTESLPDPEKVRNYALVKTLLKNLKAGYVAQAKRCGGCINLLSLL